MAEIIMRPRWYLAVMVALMIAGVLAYVSLGHAQISKKTTIEYYKITARLQALNLDGNWAQFNGRRWELADNFTKAGLPRDWQKKRNLQFKDNQNVWVNFYVSVRREVSYVAEKMRKKEKIILIDKPAEIQQIHERGGKIYRIEVLPA